MKKINILLASTSLLICFSAVGCNPDKKTKTVTLTALSVSGPDKDFEVNDTINKSEISVYSIYSDYTYKKVTDFTCPQFATSDTYTFTSIGATEFNISYGGLTKTLTIHVDTEDEYTILIYMCASTLESDLVEYEEQLSYSKTYGYASIDVSEILSTIDANPDNINIVIRAGGTAKWGTFYNNYFDKDYIRTFHVSDHALVKDKETKYSSSVSMSKESQLQDFLTYGKTYYPAKKTALILWNHGGGMQGVCQDSRYEETACLTNYDVSTALNNSGFTGDDKLEWIGYDACLMSVQDVASFNSKYANYMISSQENEPAYGWDYDAWLETLYLNPTIETESLLKNIADSYITDCEGYGATTGTISVLDLKKSSTYDTAWNSFSTTVKNKIATNKTNWQSFANTIRNSATMFGTETYSASSSSSGPYTTTTFCPFNLYDVKKAISTLQSSSYSSVLSTVLSTLNTSLNNYVIYKKNGSSYSSTSGPCGLSFFCLIEKNVRTYLKIDDEIYYTNFASSVSWYSSTQTSYSTWRNMCVSYGEYVS